MSAKEPYVSAKEPYASAKEAYTCPQKSLMYPQKSRMYLQKPYVSTKEPYMSAKVPHVSTKGPSNHLQHITATHHCNTSLQHIVRRFLPPKSALRAQLQVIFRQRDTHYMALLRKMTYKDKASYGSSPLCSTQEYALDSIVCQKSPICPQKSIVYQQKSCMYLQKSPT